MNKFCFCLLFLLLASNSHASPVSSKLSGLLNQITNLKTLLFKHQSQQTILQKQLEKIEVTINDNALKVQSTQNELTNKQKILKKLAAQESELKQKMKKQEALLLQQIRASYLLGLNKNKFQLLLLSKDPETLQRMLTYHHFFISLHSSLLTSLKQDAADLAKSQADIKNRTIYLFQLKKQQLLQQQTLDAHKSNQQILLQKIHTQVSSQTEKLRELQENKRNLEAIIHQLQKKEAYTPSVTNTHNRSSWPTAGKIIEQFGSPIQSSELKQSGVLIAAPEGQKVFAVAAGKVIFANWMPGYGLLLIIDHGKGYMSLYGNNGVVYKKKNDLVSMNELISTVGHTGGQQKSVLYFALRNNGKPINPKIWCH